MVDLGLEIERWRFEWVFRGQNENQFELSILSLVSLESWRPAIDKFIPRKEILKGPSL